MLSFFNSIKTITGLPSPPRRQPIIRTAQEAARQPQSADERAHAALLGGQEDATESPGEQQRQGAADQACGVHVGLAVVLALLQAGPHGQLGRGGRRANAQDKPGSVQV